ncbi:MAG: alpha-L-rhamnosidase N-terminal domain-containing protein [Acidipropionibacterium sp.]|jgi:alpha-L-rhamnosidase|nr:alpha-L-rhamnosidase N-terminal domain-containing protein [Acidipropionibacterium sp.]
MPQNRLNPGAEALSTAHWISRSSQQTSTARQAPVFRREFRLAASSSSATLRIAGLGLHAIRINGVPVGSGALEPAISDPRRVVYYARHDVTPLLRAGDNTVEVTLGRGFFDMATPEAWRWDQAPWRAEPRLICALTREITLPDGGPEGNPGSGETILVSDGGWICGEGPIRFDSMYEGES